MFGLFWYLFEDEGNDEGDDGGNDEGNDEGNDRGNDEGDSAELLLIWAWLIKLKVLPAWVTWFWFRLLLSKLRLGLLYRLLAL